MAQLNVPSSWSRAQVTIAATLLTVVVVAVLYLAAEIFIPFVLAIFFTFLLSPVVSYLQRKGLGRVPSVLIVTAATALIIVGLSWVVTRQVSSLIGELPAYTPNIKTKVRQLREAGLGNGGGRFEQMYEEIVAELNAKPSEMGKPEDVAVVAGGKDDKPAVVVETTLPPWLTYLVSFIPSMLGVIAQAGLASVLSVFMLLKREDLRNRFLRLAGRGHLTVTTRAVDEAAQRISKFLLMQLLINSVFGILLTIGLAIIGVKYALLWGVVAALMRYVPYVGTWVGLLFPLALSLFTFPGWTQPILVLVYYLTLELLGNNLLEPYLFGSTVGVSEVALLVMAAVWTFLWGPIGLMLSIPLTVCLVVIGKYVPQLEALDVLLGDQPPLDPHITYYQRLLAHDQDEASDIVQAYIDQRSREQVYDGLLVPALCYARRDRERDDLSDQDEEFVLNTTRAVMADVGPVVRDPDRRVDADEAGPIKVLGLATRDEMDETALHLFRQLMDMPPEQFEIAPAEMLTGEQVNVVVKRQPGIVCVASLPPGGLSHARYLVMRLRASFPDAKILVGRWGLKGNIEENERQLTEAGADQIATTLLESRNQLHGWLPVVNAESSPEDRRKRIKERVGNGRT